MFIPTHEEDLTALFKQIEIYSRKFDKGEYNIIKQLDDTLLEILLLLCSDAVHERAKLLEPLNDPVFEACRYIDINCQNEIRADFLAHMLSMSADHLTRLFRQEIGITLSEYIFNARMKKARYLLESTDHNIDTVASRCGFSSTAYFIKRFKDKNGVTPKKYRENIFKGNTVCYFNDFGKKIDI